LTERTIWLHLATLVGRGQIDVNRLVSTAVQEQVRNAADEAGRERLAPIKERLPAQITYEQIRCVLASMDTD
jgi:uncharacterized protein YpbB